MLAILKKFPNLLTQLKDSGAKTGRSQSPINVETNK